MEWYEYKQEPPWTSGSSSTSTLPPASVDGKLGFTNLISLPPVGIGFNSDVDISFTSYGDCKPAFSNAADISTITYGDCKPAFVSAVIAGNRDGCSGSKTDV